MEEGTAETKTYLATLEPKDQSDFVSFNNLLLDFGWHPTLGGIWLPGPRAYFIAFRHYGVSNRAQRVDLDLVMASLGVPGGIYALSMAVDAGKSAR